MRNASMTYSPGREELIDRLGAEGPADAVSLVLGTRETDAHPRERRALLAFLLGGTVREVSADMGVSEHRTFQLIRRAADDVVRVREAENASRSHLERLTNRSRRSLDRSGLDTDEKVRRVVAFYGAKALLTLETFGVYQHREVCDAFGFDPDEPVRLPNLSDQEVRSLSAPPYAHKTRRIRELILADERVFASEAQEVSRADTQETDLPDDSPSP